MKTLYERYLELDKEKDIDVLKFYFNNSVTYSNRTNRKFRSGIKIEGIIFDRYFEYDRFTNIILEYPLDENNNIGQCMGEILLDEFVSSLKRCHNLVKD